MTDLKSFHLGDLISITDGHLVAPGHMDSIYAILDHLTGQSLFTHQLPTAGRAMNSVLREQHPFLNDIVWDASISEIEDNEARKAVIDSWLADLSEKYGEFHVVIPADQWKEGKL